MARWTLLAVVPTSTRAFYVITLLICDEVIRLRFLGLVIHFADLLWLFEVAALAHWISLTAYIASKQFPGLCSSVGVIAECFPTNWDLINFALLVFRYTCANQGHHIKYENCQRHLACSRPKKIKKLQVSKAQWQYHMIVLLYTLATMKTFDYSQSRMSHFMIWTFLLTQHNNRSALLVCLFCFSV